MYSNETPTLKLPQYTVDDHPDFLTDINRAFIKIDNAVTEIMEEIKKLNNFKEMN